jgi:hypothetical protein
LKVTFHTGPGPTERYAGRTKGHRYVLDLRAKTFRRLLDGDIKCNHSPP